jgi:AraC-like DNA-binding protein
LGPPRRLPNSARTDYLRQLSWAVEEEILDPRTREFLHVATFQYSDQAGKDFYPSQAHMAGVFHCSRRTVQRRIAAAKASKLLDVAQLKGFDGTTWYCSSNTHRIKILPEWLEIRRAELAEKRARKSQEKIEARAQRPGSKAQGSSNEESTTYANQEHVYEAQEPPAPPTLEELEANRKRAEANRAALMRPPP